MVGDSDWTVEDIIAEDRIRHIEVRAVNEESGEVYVHKSETVGAIVLVPVRRSL